MNRFASLAPVLACLSLILAAGCTPDDQMLEYVESDVAKIKIDDLTRTMDFVTSEVRFDQDEFKSQVANGLNRWISYSSDRVGELDWQPDALAAPLMEKYSELPMVQRLDEYSYLNTDPYYLQQVYWIGLVAKRVAESSRLKTYELYRLAADDYRPDGGVEDPVQEVVARLHPELTEDADVRTLTTSLKLFDWICRNVQLESDQPLSDAEAEERRLDPAGQTPAESGVPGLGYQRYPWQTLVYGRGDYVERAKVMILALRSLDVDAVLLATGQDQHPWAVAVPVAGQYYLFDTRMALPVPGEKTGSIATLAQLQAKPEMLRALDLTTAESLADDTNYWVQADDLQQLTGLIYGSPEALSKRMAALEASLVGEDRMRLTFGMQEIQDRLPAAEGVQWAPWDIAWVTHQYRQVIREALEDSSSVTEDKLKWYYLTEGYVNAFGPYRTTRGRFLQGKFQEVEVGLNALEGCQQMIYTDDQIASLGLDIELQGRHGIYQEGRSKAEFDNMVASVQGQMQLIRDDAKLFLAQCLFDNTNENAAGSWLEDLQASESDGRWAEGVAYLLARSYESRKEYDQAVAVLSDSERIQAHGNLIRARLLKQLVKSIYGEDLGAPAASTETAEPPSQDAPADGEPEASDKTPDDGDGQEKAADAPVVTDEGTSGENGQETSGEAGSESSEGSGQ